MRAGTGRFSFVQEALGRKQFNPRDIAGGKTGLGVADTSTRRDCSTRSNGCTVTPRCDAGSYWETRR